MPVDRFFHPRAGHSRKVDGLSDLAFRVWWTYIMAADDYGVLPRSPVVIQAANVNLARRSKRAVCAALDQVVDARLVVPFGHQGEWFVCQLDWQDWQKVRYPRESIHPTPPPDILDQCSGAQRELFALRVQRSGKVPEMDLEGSSRARTREEANGIRQEANGNGLRQRFDEFWEVYPRKVAKDAAWRAWQKRRPHNDLTRIIIAAVTAQRESPDWQKEQGQFIPHPATWLNRGQWQDETRLRSLTSSCPHEDQCSTRKECLERTLGEARAARETGNNAGAA